MIMTTKEVALVALPPVIYIFYLLLVVHKESCGDNKSPAPLARGFCLATAERAERNGSFLTTKRYERSRSGR
jgi:hypothetical protein